MRKALAAAALLGLLAACSSGQKVAAISSAPSATDSPAVTDSLTIEPTPTETAFADNHGIVMLQCNAYSPELSILDLVTGTVVASRTFELPDDGSARTYGGCDSLGSLTGRSAFDARYDKVAVDIQTQGTANSTAGYAGYDTGVAEVSDAASSDFSDAPNQDKAVFRPGGSELEFTDENTGKVMVIETAGDTPRPFVGGKAALYRYYSGPLDGVSINPSGTIAISPQAGPSSDPMQPHGSYIAVFRPGQSSSDYQTIDFKHHDCSGAQWISNDSFVCLDSRGGLYRVKISPKYKVLSDIALLPSTKRTIENMIVSRDGSQVVFTSKPTQDALSVDLYALDLRRGSQPRKVTSVSADYPGPNIALIDWL